MSDQNTNDLKLGEARINAKRTRDEALMTAFIAGVACYVAWGMVITTMRINGMYRLQAAQAKNISAQTKLYKAQIKAMDQVSA